MSTNWKGPKSKSHSLRRCRWMVASLVIWPWWPSVECFGPASTCLTIREHVNDRHTTLNSITTTSTTSSVTAITTRRYASITGQDIIQEEYFDDDDITSEIGYDSLSPKQEEALDLIKLGHNVFLTGVAGTGKSLVLKLALEFLRNAYQPKEYAALGSTGPVAIALGGQTIHSFAGIGIPQINADFGKGVIRRKRAWKDLKVLVLDEASMISGEFFDLLSEAVGVVRGRPEEPFGGIQLVLCGDFLQLSPISPRTSDVEQMVTALEKKGESSGSARESLFLNRGFCFQAYHWHMANFSIVELEEVYRQQNGAFVSVLQRIRSGIVDRHVMELLRGCQRPLPPNEFGIRPTMLHSKNVDVTRENLAELRKLPGNAKCYDVLDTIEKEKGAGKWVEDQLWKSQFFKNCIAEPELQLKLGAQVMLIKNEMEGRRIRRANGSRGKVIGFRKAPARTDTPLLPGVIEYPIVQFVDGSKKLVLPTTFQCRMMGMGTCTRLAIPLKLAWAMTTHKSQGLTLDYVVADVGAVFAEGQTYVALSRASDLQGLELRNFHPTRVRTNPLALSFYKNSSKISYPYWDGHQPDPKQAAAVDEIKEARANRRSLVPPSLASVAKMRSASPKIRQEPKQPSTSAPGRRPSRLSGATAPRKTSIESSTSPAQTQRQPVDIATLRRKGPKNHTFVFSGMMQLLKRSDAEQMVVENGGHIRKSVASTTDFLVIGPTLKNGKPTSMGAEYKKATSSSWTQILSEEEFLKLVVPF